MKKTLIRHTGLFAASVVLAILFLLLGACLPQAPIDANIRDSADAMLEEGSYPLMADRAFASILDRTTDALILGESKATTISQWETIFTNPQYIYDNPYGSAVYDFHLYSEDPDPQPSKFYTHYWMGFRPVIRLMLCFLDYHQILRYTAVAFFILFAAVTCSVAGRAGTKAAFLFALSIIFIRPHVISVSLQFSSCFFIAFPAMLAIPWLCRHRNWTSLFFLELGILTQYFDFYTTPVLTFVLPMTYLYLLSNQEQAAPGLKEIGTSALSWSAGYGFMWLAKLVLTSLFTEVNSLALGLESFRGRVGIDKVSGMEEFYSPMAALRSVAASLYSDREGKLILLITVAVVFLVLLGVFLKGKHHPRELLGHPQLLVLAALPVIWFVAAAQPTANHHWFQYRSIAGSFWAGFLYLQFLLERKPDSSST